MQSLPRIERGGVVLLGNLGSTAFWRRMVVTIPSFKTKISPHRSGSTDGYKDLTGPAKRN